MHGLPIDHVAIAVPSLAEAVPLYERLSGASGSPPETLEEQGVRVAFVGDVELLEPLGADTPVGRFLERRGPGLHHLAYRTPDLRATLARLAADGFEAVDPEPRRGARGHLVAFLHPRGTGHALVELVQVSDS
jgi:methylmalonyl-CoA/ethylmalonyl-CoA epimerase